MSNSTETLTPADFLLARIAEDEAVAQSVIDARPGSRASDAAWHVAAMPEPAATHVLRWGPFSVLAECKTKRAIVEYATGRHTSSVEGYDIMRIMAAAYAGHPDYRDDWRP